LLTRLFFAFLLPFDVRVVVGAQYDIDKDGGITKDELAKFFLSSLMVQVDDNLRELASYFVDQVFNEMDKNGNGSMTIEEAMEYISTHPEVTDIYGLFGRSMATGDANAPTFLEMAHAAFAKEGGKDKVDAGSRTGTSTPGRLSRRNSFNRRGSFSHDPPPDADLRNSIDAELKRPV
jgi:hypothetical protein